MNPLYDLLPQDALTQRIQPPFPLIVLVAPFAASRTMLAFAARLALYTPLRVLDGGNRFNAREVARLLRHLNAPDLYQAMGGIQVRRAFTCYQMTALLEDTPPSSQPSLVIDLLDTFYDESAPLPERRSLIERCMQQLHNLSSLAPTVASVRPPQPSNADPTGLLEIVQNAGDLLWLPEEEAAVKGSKRQPSEPPLKLF
jgi:hypothetical protein